MDFHAHGFDFDDDGDQIHNCGLSEGHSPLLASISYAFPSGDKMMFACR